MGLFSAFGPDLTLAVQPPEDWHKVLDKISTGKMPPRTSASLATGNRGRYQFNRAAVEAFRINREAGPGRVTARRLNRVEYNNPIRDLLGVHLRPAD